MVQGGLGAPLTIDDSFFRVADPRYHLKKNKGIKPSLFKSKNNEGLSVDWAARTCARESARRQAHRWDYAPTHVAEVRASLVLELGLNVRPDPKPENDSHCEIYGFLLHNGPPEGTLARQRLANECIVLGPFEQLDVLH